MSEHDPVCFHCGSSVRTAFENTTSDGRACAPCRQRALDSLPSLLPREGVAEEVLGEMDEALVEVSTTHEAHGEADSGPEARTRTSARTLRLLPGVTGGSDDGPVRA